MIFSMDVVRGCVVILVENCRVTHDNDTDRGNGWKLNSSSR